MKAMKFSSLLRSFKNCGGKKIWILEKFRAEYQLVCNPKSVLGALGDWGWIETLRRGMLA